MTHFLGAVAGQQRLAESGGSGSGREMAERLRVGSDLKFRLAAELEDSILKKAQPV